MEHEGVNLHASLFQKLFQLQDHTGFKTTKVWTPAANDFLGWSLEDRCQI